MTLPYENSTSGERGNRILTQKRLIELLHYDPIAGIFTWKTARRGRAKAGTRAGTKKSPEGYRSISVDAVMYSEHRLVWLYVYGKFPDHHLDHINGITSDNRLENLRDVTVSGNVQNQRKAHSNSTSGLLGVSFNKRDRKWYSQILIDRKKCFLGYFKSADEAHQAYLDAKRAHHKTCTI